MKKKEKKISSIKQMWKNHYLINFIPVHDKSPWQIRNKKKCS